MHRLAGISLSSGGSSGNWKNKKMELTMDTKKKFAMGGYTGTTKNQRVGVVHEAVDLGPLPFTFTEKVSMAVSGIANMLELKNASYGNSALDPIRVFSKASAEEQLKVRIDDKLSRIQRGGDDLGEDTIDDLIGYLLLYKIQKGNF